MRSREQLRLVSANAEVDLAAGRAVHLATSGGASLTIEDGNIVIACPGEIAVHAGKKSFSGPTQLSRELNSWPETRFNEEFQVLAPGGRAVRNRPYRITRADGAVMHGTTDDEGRVALQRGLGVEQVSIEILPVAQGEGR